MLRIFLRDNWPLIVGASIGLPISAYLVQQATGQPLLPDLSWLAPILSTIAVAAAWAGGLLLFGLLLYVFIVPIVNKIRNMEWERRQDRATEQRQVAAPPSERPIIVQHSGSNLALKAERAKRKNLELLLESISTELSSLCHQVTGQQEPDAVRAIKVLGDGWSETRETMRELDAQLSEIPRETPQEPTGASPRGTSWRDALALMEWARERDRIGVRATRDLLRGRGVPIPEQEFGAFSAYVQALAPLPHRLPMPQEQRPQRADNTDNNPRTAKRARIHKLPRKGRR